MSLVLVWLTKDNLKQKNSKNNRITGTTEITENKNIKNEVKISYKRVGWVSISVKKSVFIITLTTTISTRTKIAHFPPEVENARSTFLLFHISQWIEKSYENNHSI